MKMLAVYMELAYPDKMIALPYAYIYNQKRCTLRYGQTAFKTNAEATKAYVTYVKAAMLLSSNTSRQYGVSYFNVQRQYHTGESQWITAHAIPVFFDRKTKTIYAVEPNNPFEPFNSAEFGPGSSWQSVTAYMKALLNRCAVALGREWKVWKGHRGGNVPHLQGSCQARTPGDRGGFCQSWAAMICDARLRYSNSTMIGAMRKLAADSVDGGDHYQYHVTKMINDHVRRSITSVSPAVRRERDSTLLNAYDGVRRTFRDHESRTARSEAKRILKCTNVMARVRAFNGMAPLSEVIMCTEAEPPAPRSSATVVTYQIL